MHFLGSNLRHLRKKSGKNQGQIAEMVGKGQTTVGNWEGGVSEPSLKDLLILSNYYGISVDDLLRIDLTETNGKNARQETRDYPLENAGQSLPMVMEGSEDVLIPILKELESIRQEINDMKERFG